MRSWQKFLLRRSSKSRHSRQPLPLCAVVFDHPGADVPTVGELERVMADFKQIQSQNGGGLPPTREELHHIMSQIYLYQTGRSQVPATFFNAVIDGLIKNHEHGGPGTLGTAEIQNLVAQYATNVTAQMTGESHEPATLTQLQQIQLLMAEFTNGVPLNLTEQEAYNERLASILPGFKALFSDKGQFTAFEQQEVTRVVTTTTEATSEKVSKVEQKQELPPKQDTRKQSEEFLEYELAGNSTGNADIAPGLLHNVANTSLPPSIATWEEVFSHNLNKFTHPLHQAPAIETRNEGLFSHHQYEPAIPTQTYIPPTTKIPNHMGTSIDAVSLPPPPIDQFKFTSHPSIVKAQFERKLQDQTVFTPNVEPLKEFHADCIVLNESQAAQYFQWRVQHTKDPFSQFMDYIRHSPFNGPNLSMPKSFITNTTQAIQANHTTKPNLAHNQTQPPTPGVANIPIVPEIKPQVAIPTYLPSGTYIGNTFPLRTSDSIQPAISTNIQTLTHGTAITSGLPTDNTVQKIPNSISITPVSFGQTSPSVNPQPSAHLGTQSFAPVNAIPSIQSPLSTSLSVRPAINAPLSNHSTSPNMANSANTASNNGNSNGIYQPAYPYTGAPLNKPTPGSPQPHIMASNLTTSVQGAAIPTPIQVSSRPLSSNVTNTINRTPPLHPGARIEAPSTVTVDRDWRHEVKVVEERSDGRTALPVMTSKTITQHEVVHETSVLNGPTASSTFGSQPQATFVR
jgi:hypothetical protein